MGEWGMLRRGGSAASVSHSPYGSGMAHEQLAVFVQDPTRVPQGYRSAMLVIA